MEIWRGPDVAGQLRWSIGPGAAHRKVKIALKPGNGPGKAIARRAHASGPFRRSDAAAERPCPGLSRCFASNAVLTRICWSRSIALNICGIRSRFSMPTPCSPVSTPPTFDAET